MVLNLLNLQTINDFRAVCWHTPSLVDNLVPYCAIVKHVPNALRALIGTRMAINFTAEDIYETLCIEERFNCENFGPYLDLFTGRRYWYICVTRLKQLLSMPADLAKKMFHLSTEQMSRLPTLISVSRERMSFVRMLSADAVAQLDNLVLPPPAFRNLGCTARLFLQFRAFNYCDHHRFVTMVKIPVINRRVKSKRE